MGSSYSSAQPTLECPICRQRYDGDQHRPVLLGVCTHTACRHCLSHMPPPRRCAKCRALLSQSVASLDTDYAALNAVRRAQHRREDEPEETLDVSLQSGCERGRMGKRL